MLRIFLIIFLFLGIAIQNSFAEYRVFLLKISKKSPLAAVENSAKSGATAAQEQSPAPQNPAPAASQDKTFLSTLDPEQYKALYPLGADETISYTETWRCYGRTGGGVPFCPNPKTQPVGNSPTSDQASSPETNIQNPVRTPASPP